MIHVTNQKTIANLSRKSLKADKTRNLVAVIAIALTTVLFTSFFTIGMSMLKSMEQSTMRQVGSSAHGSFKYLTADQFDKIKNHPFIKEMGYSVLAAFPENREFNTRPVEMRYATDQQAEFFFSVPTTGRMPQKENELATDTIVLDKLGIPHRLGQTVTLEYTIADKKYSQEFVLCGFWPGDKAAHCSMAFVSEDFFTTNAIEIGPEHNKNGQEEAGEIFVDVMFDNSFNIEGKLQKILSDNGYTEDDIPIGVNWAYASSKIGFDFGTIAGILGALLLIIFTGYLIIYNIFYISIARDTKFYGMLKTIGTTAKQIKAIVRKQALFLSMVSIPIGLVLGYVIGIGLVPFVMQSLSATHVTVSFSPVIFLGAALFSLITVFLSCRKPTQIASKISPIEALRYSDTSAANNKKIKKTANGAKSYKMAYANVFRNRKKALIVLASLSLSIILLNSVYTIVTGFDMEKFLSEEIVRDFQIADVAYFNPYKGYTDQTTVTEKMVQKISAMDGIEGMGRIYFQEKNHQLSPKAQTWFKESLPDIKGEAGEDMKHQMDRGEIPSHLYGLDRFVWDEFKIYQGKFDAQKFAAGKYAVVSIPGFMSDTDKAETYYDVGDTITVSFDNGVQKSYEILAVGNIPFNLNVRHNHMSDMDIYLPSDEYKANVKNPLVMTAVFNVDEQHIDSMEDFLADYTENQETMLGYSSRKMMAKEFTKVQSTFRTVGYSLSFIVALIGLLNFVNSMITSIISRRKEFAMMQSIGMTGRQLKKMITVEGLYYGLITIAIVLTLGIPLNYLGVQAIAGSIWFFSYHFTVLPVLICVPCLIIISLIVPVWCYSGTSRISIVERLRESE